MTYRPANRTRLATFLVPCGVLIAAASVARAEPMTASGYTLTPFATAPAGSSAPDSVAVVGNDVYVGFGNGGNPDGSGGAVSTIAEYNRTGGLLGTTSVVGHNDGLRYDAATGKLWAIQNEDANPNLVLITPGSLAKSAPYTFGAASHGGGYDDVAFVGGKAFVSASNPANNPNTKPALIGATLGAGVVNVTGVVAGNARATVLNPGGGRKTLNLQDPDSLAVGPHGEVVLDSQADAELVFVTNPGTAAQRLAVLGLSNQVDDTAFAAGGFSTLLFAVKGANTVYALTGDFAPGAAFSAAASNGSIPGHDFIGSLDLANGILTPVVSGLNGPGGEAFFNVPEPASLAVLGSGILALVAVVRRRRRGASLAG